MDDPRKSSEWELFHNRQVRKSSDAAAIRMKWLKVAMAVLVGSGLGVAVYVLVMRPFK